MQPLSWQQRLSAFVQLGIIFNDAAEHRPWPGFAQGLNESEYQQFLAAVDQASLLNPWFTPQNINHQLSALGTMLQRDTLETWAAAYTLPQNVSEKPVAVIMAGNLPLVGFHDLLCVAISGHNVLIKPSSDDAGLTAAVVQVLTTLEPAFAGRIALASGKLTDFKAVIATGSNNSMRYFQAYFNHVPHILRGSRTSVAVLTGNESDDILKQLADDVFIHFGMGCRSISKVFLPAGFDTDRLFRAFFGYSHIINHHKYANNYDYHRAMFLMNQDKFLDNGFILLKQDSALHSPLGVLFLGFYPNPQALTTMLTEIEPEVQCITGQGFIPFGQAQCPGISDYADGVDTMQFLATL
jgi:hypothetical protein